MKKTDLSPRYVQTTPLSRADLLRCYGLYGEKGLDYVASLGLFVRKEKEKIEKKRQTTGEVHISHMKNQEDERPSGQDTRAGKPRLVYFRVTTYRKKEEEETETSAPAWYKDATPHTEANLRPDPSLVPPPGPPLTSWSRIWPFLRQAMGDTRESRVVDFPELIKRIAACLPLKKLPFLTRKAWASHSQVLFDFHDRLTIFRHDFAFLYIGIKRLRGLSGLEAFLLDSDPPGHVREVGKWKQPVRPYKFPVPGTPIFIISDLGCLDPRKEGVKSWAAFGKSLKKSGFSPIVLTPAPSRLLEPELHTLFRIVTWDRGKKITMRSRSFLQPRRQKEEIPGAAGLVETLLAMVSVAIRVEPALLRSFRYLLPLHQADAGMEAEVWHHPKTIVASQILSVAAGEQDTYRSKFKELSPQLRKKVKDHIRDYHRHLSPAIHWEEAMLFALSTNSGSKKWKTFINNCIKTLGFGGFQYQESLKEWWKRVFSRLPAGVWKDNTELGAVWVMVYRDELINNEITDLPPGLDITKYQWILETIIENRDIAFHDREDFITTEPPGTTPAVIPVPILQMSLTSPLMTVKHETEQGDNCFSAHLQKIRALEIEKKETRAIVLTTPAREITIEPITRPSWAAGMGRDEYGLFAECEVKGVTFRLRWINPGEFLMGSPENEPERFDREKQHKVILTQGYWLGETACTQELWQVVMGTNPSDFKGSGMLPVDTVSWDDCREFIKTINNNYPVLNLRLPREAEWEYACRAGTQTPFSFGKNITTDQVNYHGNYPYAGGKKGEYREKTVEVKSLPCNPWGLYEMHGNLYEWCEDWYGEYSGEEEADPTGPEKGPARVLRGGCWYGYARYVRSAYRDYVVPGARYWRYGFRLARGQNRQE